jgi:hypothetical protein
MKPTQPGENPLRGSYFEERRAQRRAVLPHTSCSFQRGYSGGSFPYDDAGAGDWHRFHNLNREFLRESARERAREMWVFAMVIAASSWPVIYMVVTVIRLLIKGRPLTS